MVRRVRLPLIIWLVFIFTAISLVGEFSFLGYQLAGWGWFIPFVFSAAILAKESSKIKFPFLVWLPWAMLVIGYLSMAGFSSLQRSIQLLCPVIVGMAVSTYRFQRPQVMKFLSLCKGLSILLILVVLVKAGILLTGKLPEQTGLAPEVMTGMLLSAIFAAGYANEGRRDIIWWGALATLPVIALTRAAIVATGLTLPLTFAPMKLRKRIVILGGIALLGVILFFTPRVQTKMFYSGQGEVSDILGDDLSTHGRSYMWEHMQEGIKAKPWFGHGANASEEFVLSLTGVLTHPHNDWLRLLYDYGLAGTVLFVLTLLFQVLHIRRRAVYLSEEAQLLSWAGASSFISFALLMFTDNIILYAAFFGNLQFTILGLLYGVPPKASFQHDGCNSS